MITVSFDMLIVVRVVVLRVRDSVRDDDVLNARVLKLCALAMLLFVPV